MLTPQPSLTVALCHAGELGAVLGRLFANHGHRVRVVDEGRSNRTRERARAHGFQPAPTLADAVRSAEIVLSVVPPAAASAMLDEVIAALAGSGHRPLYVDANSISPAAARDLYDRCRAAGLPMVDMTVHGQAAGLPGRGDLFFSGHDAAAVAGLLGPDVSTRVLGSEVGTASQFKMLLGSYSKSMVALFLEACCSARQAGVLESYLETTRSFYPGTVDAVERMLPSYPRHAPRRVDELMAAEAMLHDMGLKPGMVREARILLQRLAASPVCRRPEAVAGEPAPALLATMCDTLNPETTQRPHE